MLTFNIMYMGIVCVGQIRKAPGAYSCTYYGEEIEEKFKICAVIIQIVMCAFVKHFYMCTRWFEFVCGLQYAFVSTHRSL